MSRTTFVALGRPGALIHFRAGVQPSTLNSPSAGQNHFCIHTWLLKLPGAQKKCLGEKLGSEDRPGSAWGGTLGSDPILWAPSTSNQILPHLLLKFFSVTPSYCHLPAPSHSLTCPQLKDGILFLKERIQISLKSCPALSPLATWSSFHLLKQFQFTVPLPCCPLLLECLSHFSTGHISNSFSKKQLPHN